MKKLEILLTDKQHNLLERIAQADDRRLSDLIYLVFSSGLGVYFCERGIYVSKNDDEYTEQEIKQKEINKKLLLDNPKFHYQTEQEQKEQGFKPVESGFSNYSYSKKDFIDVLADEIKNNALNLIKQDFKEIEENTIKENTPKEDKIYSLVDGTNKKSIVNGNTWSDSEVKNND